MDPQEVFTGSFIPVDVHTGTAPGASHRQTWAMQGAASLVQGIPHRLSAQAPPLQVPGVFSGVSQPVPSGTGVCWQDAPPSAPQAMVPFVQGPPGRQLAPGEQVGAGIVGPVSALPGLPPLPPDPEGIPAGARPPSGRSGW